MLISTAVSTVTSYKITEKLSGPVCRVDLSKDRFEAPPKKTFYLNYRITNYKPENLFLEKVDAYCYWEESKNNKEEESAEKNVLKIKSATTDDLIPPAEPLFIPAYGSKPWQSKCYSPDSPGEYNIKVEVETNRGNCESNIIMMVKE